MNKQAGKREITFKCRAIGYGVVRGWASGYWNPNEMNLGGGIAFDCMSGWDGNERLGGQTLYLFNDEVVSDLSAAVDHG